jgi:hypothetical protein
MSYILHGRTTCHCNRNGNLKVDIGLKRKLDYDTVPDPFKIYKAYKTVPDSQVMRFAKIFTRLIDSQQIHQFGLSSLAELNSLRVGRQFKKYVIDGFDIKTFKQGDDVIRLIKQYPSIEVALVNTSGKIRTSMEFVQNHSSWEAFGYGSTTELTMLSHAQDVLGNSVINKGELIRIPALQISFIAIPSATGLKFLSLVDRPGLNLYMGQTLPASDALLRLVSLAKRLNGSPT